MVNSKIDPVITSADDTKSVDDKGKITTKYTHVCFEHSSKGNN